MMVTVVFPPQLEFHGPGQGMTRDWWLGARSWGRPSRGAVVRLGGLGEVRLVTRCWVGVTSAVCRWWPGCAAGTSSCASSPPWRQPTPSTTSWPGRPVADV